MYPTLRNAQQLHRIVAANEATKVVFSVFVSEDVSATVGLLNVTIVKCINGYETHMNRYI